MIPLGSRLFALTLILTLAGCATVSFTSTNARVLAGQWIAVGPEFQDYYVQIVLVHGEPRLVNEPKPRFKNESAKEQYVRKYGELIRTVDAFGKAVNSLAEIAAMGQPSQTTEDDLSQIWVAREAELLWIRRHYRATGGIRDPNALYEDLYRLDFDSATSGKMLFDGKRYDLVRQKHS